MDTYHTAKAKDFWNYTFVLTSTRDHPLSTAITSCLEADLIKLALDFGRAVINVNQPRPLALEGQERQALAATFR